MLEEQTTLMAILKEVIKEYEGKLTEVEEVNSSIVLNSKKLISNLKSNIENIIGIDLDEIKNILTELDLTDEEKNKIYGYFETIKKLLILNKEQKTTYQITDNQLENISLFFKKVEDKVIEKSKIQSKNMIIIGKITSVLNRYRELYKRLENKENNIFIDDVSLIEMLFEEVELDQTTKNSIMTNLIKYNKDIYEDIKEEKKYLPEEKKLDRTELGKLFKKYGYDYKNLDKKIKQEILVLGNYKNIKEMFEVLDELNIKVEDEKILGLILLNCEKDVFINIVKYSITKGIDVENLLKIIPVLVPQSNKIEAVEDYILIGKSDDFVRNVELFEGIGLDLNLIFKRCKEIFLRNNFRLVNTYKDFRTYGFSISNEDLEEKLTSTKLSALLSDNFSKTADQLLEVSKEGVRYLQENLKDVNRIASSNNLIIYNIYASYLNKDYENRPLRSEGPFIRVDLSNLKLRSEITRYIDSGYEKIPYRDIEEDNKDKVCMIYDKEIEHIDEFNKAIERSLNDSNLKLLEKDEKIKVLDEFIDKDKVRYNFNGVYISKAKVLRIYNILKNYKLDNLSDSLLFTITYNSLLNEQDFNKIKNLLLSRGY